MYIDSWTINECWQTYSRVWSEGVMSLSVDVKHNKTSIKEKSSSSNAFFFHWAGKWLINQVHGIPTKKHFDPCLKYLRGGVRHWGALGIDWLAPTQVFKVSNFGLFCMRVTKIMTVWISGNSGFLITHRHTNRHTDTCELYN